MAGARSQSPSLRPEELQVLVTGDTCERRVESRGQAAGEHQQWWKRIQVPACEMLQQSVESELSLAAKEQTLGRRAALEQLLQAEQQQQQRELAQLGKAFYVERL